MARKKRVSLKRAMILALLDTVDVVLYSGVPATGVVVYLEMFQEGIPELAKYGPYIASLINVAIFWLKRTREYYVGIRKPK